MNYVNLGSTDLIISEVGFGCIPIIRLSTDAAVQVLRHAFERGITLIFFNCTKSLKRRIGWK